MRMEADLEGDQHGLKLTAIRKRHLPAQKIVVRLLQLAHNMLVWARQWFSQHAPRLRGYDIVPLIRESGPSLGGSS